MPLPDHFSLLVLGQGTTGLDVVRWALPHLGGRVRSITVYGGARSARDGATTGLEARGVRFAYGTEAVEGSYDVCVASPGISEFSDFYASARAHADVIMGEPEFAYRLSPERWIGITGTNGKTTTTTLVRELLVHAGMPAQAVGNIGDTAISRVAGRADGSWFVAELSSYQLATTSELHPRVAVLLNITDDHLSWHRTHEAYARAKCRLFRNLGEGDLAIVDGEDAGIQAVRDEIARPGVRVLTAAVRDGGEQDAAFVRAGRLVVRMAGIEHELAAVDDMRIKGHHNVINALAAAAAALFVGADARAVAEELEAFEPLEHRIEPVAEVDGVRFVNDSKATNTDAVEKALTAFPNDRVVLLLGGSDKGTPLEDFARHVMDRVGAVVCFGAARKRFLAAMEDAGGSADVDIADADNLRDAVDVARTLAGRGDVVLLSPACASFDEFNGFEERGLAFKAYVNELAAAGEERD